MALKHLTLPNGTTLDINDARSVVIGDDIYNVVALTSEEYQALQVKDENTLYIVTDSSGGGGGGGGGDITPSATVHNSLISIIMNEETVGSFTTNSANAVNIDLGTVITQIKTINNQSLIGTGNITISGGGGSGDENVIEAITFNGAAVPVANKTAAITASTPGTLVTNNTTAQATSASESLSGTINLHKVAKTGTYDDLISKPTIENFYFVQGSSSAAGNSTSGAYLSTKWEGTIPGVSAATNGLKIAYRIATNTGVSTAGVVLSIDGTNYYPVVIQKNTLVTTHYPVGSTPLMVFNSTQTASAYLTSNTKTTVTGCWQIMEYDSNTNTYQRLYVSTGDTEYPITTRYNTTSGETYYAEYGRYAAGVTLNPSTNAITASKFIVSGGASSDVLLGNGTTSGLKTVNNESIFGTGNISVSGGGGDTNVIETVKVNGTALTPDANKAVDVSVPTESTVSGWGFTKNTGTYSKPSGGIPSTDLASAVQTSLGKADTALQSYTETDPTVPSWAKASTKPTYTASEVGALPDTTSIPNESTVSGWGFTKNAGTITGITMNGSSKGTSGVVNLGTVVTSETDPVFTASAAHGISSTDISNWNAKQKAITVSSSEPTSSQGSNGDIWIVI